MKFPGFLLMAVLTVIFYSCDENRIYETNHDLNEKEWNEDSVLSFSFKVTDIEKGYNFYYNIRNTRAFPFHNLYLKYSLEDSLGNVLSSDLHNINLFDPKTGKPFGDGLGDIFDHQIMSIENFNFDKPSTYYFKVQQYMRMKQLPEIMSVGLRVEKAK